MRVLPVLGAAALALLSAPPSAAQGPSFDYTGSGSCASSQCHGSPRPRSDNRVAQDEHTLWATRDEHAQAYAHLLSDRSRLIARNLRIAGPPEKEDRCLVCHALVAPAERRGRSFDLADGVSCETCHGPAAEWLGPHTTRGWTHSRSVELGMRDTKDPIVRAQTCSGCHVGDASRRVDHELYAAGHPELVFEMEWASAAMPRHWREAPERGPFFTTRLWAVGQAVTLRDQMRRAGLSAAGAGADYGEFDCGACHHELQQKSWRQARGYEGRRPGDPPVDLTRWRVLAPLARRVAPEPATRIEAAARDLAAAGASAEPMRDAAERLAEAADALARRLAEPGVDLGRQATQELLAALAADGAPARDYGYRGAGQIAMSVDSLARALLGSAPSKGAPLDAAVEKLFDALEDPSRYDPAGFTTSLEAVAARLRETSGGSR